MASLKPAYPPQVEVAGAELTKRNLLTPKRRRSKEPKASVPTPIKGAQAEIKIEHDEEEDEGLAWKSKKRKLDSTGGGSGSWTTKAPRKMRRDDRRNDEDEELEEEEEEEGEEGKEVRKRGFSSEDTRLSTEPSSTQLPEYTDKDGNSIDYGSTPSGKGKEKTSHSAESPEKGIQRRTTPNDEGREKEKEVDAIFGGIDTSSMLRKLKGMHAKWLAFVHTLNSLSETSRMVRIREAFGSQLTKLVSL